jgi:hypothetical protein
LSDAASAVATDSAGNVYVTGCTMGVVDGSNAGAQDFFVAKYDAAGARQWVRQLGGTGDDCAAGIAVDVAGNAYVTGVTSGNLDGNVSAGSYDIFLTKYDTNGAKQWTRQFGGTGGDVPTGIAYDGVDSLYVVGSTSGDLDGIVDAGNGDAFVIKYTTDGGKVWTRLLGTAAGDGASGVALDSAGNVYVSGGTSGAIDGSVADPHHDIFVASLDASGGTRWIRQFGTTSGDEASAIATSPSGDVFLFGLTAGSLDGIPNAGSNDVLVVKYTDDGRRR